MEKKDRVEILFEDIRSKFELVLEGHSVLNHKIDSVGQETHQKIDLLDEKISLLNRKIDAAAADLAAHRPPLPPKRILLKNMRSFQSVSSSVSSVPRW